MKMSLKNKVKWFMAIMLITPVLVNALPTKVTGEMWGRWTNEQIKAADGKDKISKNYFSLERGYFGLEPTFTLNTKGRFTVDIYSTDATYMYATGGTDTGFPVDSLSVTKSGTVDGVGLKLKYAYVDFANLVPVPEMNLTVGLQKVYFGTIYDWNYNIIGKAPSDEYKVANSSDYGITVNGYIPNGMGEYAVGVYNGEGYKKVGASLADNTNFAYLANLRLTPISGVTLGGSYMSNSVNREKALTNDALNSKYEEDGLMDGVLRLNYNIVDFWGEYISKDMSFPNATGKDYTAKGLMLMPIVSLQPVLGKDVQILVRYDSWDESDNPSAAAQYVLNTTTIGANYNFLPDESNVPAMQLQLNYSMKKYNEDKSAASYANGAKDSNLLLLQLKWRFASTISN
jgi:hypothetical protein